MKQVNSKTKRERFWKLSYHLVMEEPSLSRLPYVFQNFHLHDFREELHLWQRVALCNDQSAYDEAASREDLIDFITQLQRLIEAWYLVTRKKQQHKASKKRDKKLKETEPSSNRLDMLTKEEQAKPSKVIQSFGKTFTADYANAELLDMLDAMMTYKGVLKVRMGSLVFFYEHLSYLVRLAFSKASF